MAMYGIVGYGFYISDLNFNKKKLMKYCENIEVKIDDIEDVDCEVVECILGDSPFKTTVTETGVVVYLPAIMEWDKRDIKFKTTSECKECMWNLFKDLLDMTQEQFYNCIDDIDDTYAL